MQNRHYLEEILYSLVKNKNVELTSATIKEIKNTPGLSLDISAYDFLFLAIAYNNDYKIVSLLLDILSPMTVAATLKKVDDKGRTIFLHAARHGNADILSKIIEIYRDLNPDIAGNAKLPWEIADQHNSRPLHFSAQHGHFSCVQIILENSEKENRHNSIRQMNHAGDTALHVALRASQFEIAEYLIAHGAGLWIENFNRSLSIEENAIFLCRLAKNGGLIGREITAKMIIMLNELSTTNTYILVGTTHGGRFLDVKDIQHGVFEPQIAAMEYHQLCDKKDEAIKNSILLNCEQTLALNPDNPDRENIRKFYMRCVGQDTLLKILITRLQFSPGISPRNFYDTKLIMNAEINSRERYQKIPENILDLIPYYRDKVEKAENSLTVADEDDGVVIKEDENYGENFQNEIIESEDNWVEQGSLSITVRMLNDSLAMLDEFGVDMLGRKCAYSPTRIFVDACACLILLGGYSAVLGYGIDFAITRYTGDDQYRWYACRNTKNITFTPDCGSEPAENVILFPGLFGSIGFIVLLLLMMVLIARDKSMYINAKQWSDIKERFNFLLTNLRISEQNHDDLPMDDDDVRRFEELVLRLESPSMQLNSLLHVIEELKKVTTTIRRSVVNNDYRFFTRANEMDEEASGDSILLRPLLANKP